jgi:hypothetical protein
MEAVETVAVKPAKRWKEEAARTAVAVKPTKWPGTVRTAISTRTPTPWSATLS